MRDFRAACEFTEEAERALEFVTKIGEEVAYRGDVIMVPDEPDHIEAESRDGFIAWTNGGYDLCVRADLGAAQGSGDVPALIEPYLDRTQKDCREEFCRHRGLTEEELDAMWGTDDAILEEFYDYENEWMSEGGTFFYKVRAVFYAADNYDNRSGEDEVYLAFFLNTDFEYGRDEGNHTIWSENIPLTQFTEERLAEAVDACGDTIRKL